MWIPDDILAHVQRVSDEPDLTGTKYRLGALLGRGGMGSVYQARDIELDRDVALKVSAAEGAVPRLSREARFLATLEHPGIVPVHDVGTLPDGRVYYVMKLVRGVTVEEWSLRNTERRAALRLFQRVCEGVAFAHARGILHRDLKPENVMVGELGEVLVMDWGIAKSIATDEPAAPREQSREAPPDEHTRDGSVVGTPTFMSPEQARGDVRGIDARSDIYSLGVLLRTLLLRASSRTSEMEKPLVSICSRATAHSPDDRYGTAIELSADIGRFLDGDPVLAHRESLIERATRIAAKNQVVLGLLAAYVLARVLVFAFTR